MTELSSKQQSFIRTMKEDEEFERRGFELLLKRADFENFFDALAAAGLFDPSRNSGPVSAETPGYYRVPYWQPLAYLEAVAKLAGERSDAVLAEKVLNVIRQVSRWRDEAGNVRDNHNTWFIFAKIFGMLPTQTVSMQDIDLMPVWFGGRFNRTMVGHALAGGTLRKFVSSEHSDDWKKACRILYHCTAVELVDEKWIRGETRKKVQTVVDDFWLKEIIKGSAAALGQKVGKDAADVFLGRLREVFAPEMEGRATWSSRPAIEDHAQNYDWQGPANRFVEGFRNALLSWVDVDATKAQPYIEQLLSSGTEIVERVAIYIVDQRFEVLRSSVPCAIRPAMFEAGHLHELYQLLKNHFLEFNGVEKESTLAAIRALPMPDRGEDSDHILRRIQRNWLSAIVGKGYEPAETWHQQLTADPKLGGLSAHPDLHSYHESRMGFGPTPHSIQELVTFAEDGVIVDKLNAFVPTNSWDGPTKRSLADSVVEAVGSAPQLFLARLPSFLNAKAEYQYAIIAGFKKLWEAWDGKQTGLDWNDIWPKLIEFFEKLLNDEHFWTAEVVEDRDLSPNRNWIPPTISEFLRSGTRSDDKAFAPDLLPRTWALIKILLEKSQAQEKPSEGDALNRAINSSRGKAIEALLDHALRCCRISDETTKSHVDAWRQLQPVFDAELEACRNGNFEFSALAGAYIGNLQYMDTTWVHANIKKIFPTDFPTNCLSALDGLAFAPALGPTYSELVESGVLEWALRHEMKGEHAREKLVQRMSLAYLWGQEKLESPRFTYLFDSHQADDLEIASRFFWAIRGEPLTEEQKENIFMFWDRCVTWSATVDPVPARLLSSLSLLSCYLSSIGQRGLRLLLAVAPHISIDFNADKLVEELERLADRSPAEAGQVFNALLERYHPVFDFEDRYKKLVIKFAANPATRSYAIRGVERLRNLPGMVQLYAKISESNGH